MQTRRALVVALVAVRPSSSNLSIPALPRPRDLAPGLSPPPPGGIWGIPPQGIPGGIIAMGMPYMVGTIMG